MPIRAECSRFLALISVAFSVGGGLFAAESVVLLDPATVSIDELQTSHTELTLIDPATSRVSNSELSVKASPNHDYPNVMVPPKQSAWDLSKTPVVEMSVRNTSDHDIEVILSLENEGSDGQKGCSAGKLSIPEGQIAKLQLVTGFWFGSVNETFDAARVARVKVLVERPTRSLTFSIQRIEAVDCEHEIQDILDSEYFAKLKPFFGRGINIGNTLEAPNEGDWGGTLKDEHLNIIRQAGFDSIRLPVRWSAHASNRQPYRLEASFKKRVKHVIDEALRNDLKVVLNIHHYEELFKKPSANRDRFIELWRQIAAEYADYPLELAFEVLNEPHGKIEAEFWNQLAADAVDVIRQSNPDRWIVLGPVDWNAVSGLARLKLPEGDDRIAMTFHYYTPMEFTHQGAPWLAPDSKKWLGTTWSDSKLERTRVELDFNQALRFGFENNVPIYLGEFGAYEKAPLDSRVTWTRAIVREAAQRKFGYAYWEFYSGFGVFDPKKSTWLPTLKRAVIPGH